MLCTYYIVHAQNGNPTTTTSSIQPTQAVSLVTTGELSLVVRNLRRGQCNLAKLNLQDPKLIIYTREHFHNHRKSYWHCKRNTTRTIRKHAFSITFIANSTSHSCDHCRGGLFFSSLSQVQPQASAMVYISDTSKNFLSLSSLHASCTSNGNQSSSASIWIHMQKLLLYQVCRGEVATRQERG